MAELWQEEINELIYVFPGKEQALFKRHVFLPVKRCVSLR
jgi:hypothetical protein